MAELRDPGRSVGLSAHPATPRGRPPLRRRRARRARPRTVKLADRGEANAAPSYAHPYLVAVGRRYRRIRRDRRPVPDAHPTAIASSARRSSFPSDPRRASAPAMSGRCRPAGVARRSCRPQHACMLGCPDTQSDLTGHDVFLVRGSWRTARWSASRPRASRRRRSARSSCPRTPRRRLAPPSPKQPPLFYVARTDVGRTSPSMQTRRGPDCCCTCTPVRASTPPPRVCARRRRASSQ